MRGLFLPLAVEGQYDTYINHVCVKYGLILYYISTIILLYVSNIQSKDFFLYQFSVLLVLHLIVNTYFVFQFDRKFGLEKITIDLTRRQAFISIFKSIMAFALIFSLSFYAYILFERGRIPTNIIIAMVFPYMFANTFHGILNQGIKGFLKLIHFRET